MKNSKALCAVFCLLLISIAATEAGAHQTREQVIAEVVRLGGKVERDETKAGKPILKIDLHGTH